MGVEFSQEVFDEICDRLVDGESLRKICKDKHMPSKWAVLKWLAKDEVEGDGLLVAQYARAREAQIEGEMDEMIEIADAEEDPAKARVRIWARQWKAGKLKPKKYGDRVDHTHSIEKIERIEVEVVSAPMRDVTPKEIEQS